MRPFAQLSQASRGHRPKGFTRPLVATDIDATRDTVTVPDGAIASTAVDDSAVNETTGVATDWTCRRVSHPLPLWSLTGNPRHRARGLPPRQAHIR